MAGIRDLYKQHKEALLIAVLVIFYTVGTVGISLPAYRDLFLSLSFFNLLLSISIVLLARKQKFQQFLLFLFLCFLTGITVEIIGTKTGLLFGSYSYGANLGPKIYGVPIVIGFNWGILVVGSASFLNRLKNVSLFSKVVLSALLMTLFDVFMEPVAIASDFWSWNGPIPLYNYICWFAVSLPLHYIYFRSGLVETNKVFEALFLIMSLFFILLILF
jgi:putative membrane protein